MFETGHLHDAQRSKVETDFHMLFVHFLSSRYRLSLARGKSQCVVDGALRIKRGSMRSDFLAHAELNRGCIKCC